jgi:hypothetical protein
MKKTCIECGEWRHDGYGCTLHRWSPVILDYPPRPEPTTPACQRFIPLRSIVYPEEIRRQLLGRTEAHDALVRGLRERVEWMEANARSIAGETCGTIRAAELMGHARCIRDLLDDEA